MPRPRQAQGRPDSLVIPERWEAGHQPVAERTMHDAACEIRAPGTTQAWNAATEQMDAVPLDPYYTGGCRIQALTNDARTTVLAEDPELVAGYLVVVPADVDTAAEGHLVKVTDSHDIALTGRVLVVRDVVRGSQRFERDLYCTLTD